MWAALEDSNFVDFYRDRHAGGYNVGDDWEPMIRAVLYLQSREYSSKLFAFTSLMHFNVTTAPTYEVAEGHHSVGIIWAFDSRQFHLRYHLNSWFPQHAPERICEEKFFPTAVDALIQRLLSGASLDASAHSARIDALIHRPS